MRIKLKAESSDHRSPLPILQMGQSNFSLTLCPLSAFCFFLREIHTKVTLGAATILVLLGFLAPVQAFIASIPSCVFAGAAIILYGFIACSGIKMLQKTDLNVQKNLVIVSTVLSLGISGLVVGGTTISLSATGLALVVGIILNLVLKEKTNES